MMMKLFKTVSTVCGVALMGAILAPSTMADDWNRKTKISFSGPVEIPGVHQPGWGILPAGTYTFKILDSLSNRHIVQILDEKETTVYATIIAIPNYRLKVTDKTVITFRERPAGQPEAIRAWFYPGRQFGEEFVYPKSRAIEIAKATNMPVLYTPAEIPEEVAEPIRTADAPVVEELRRAPVMAVTPTGEDVELAQVVTPPPAEETRVEVAAAAPTPNETNVTNRPMREETLPETASRLPMIALFGFLALGGALAVRAFANRV